MYDSANQLIREDKQAGGFTHTWTYDSAGNILARSEYAYTTGELGTPTAVVTYTYGDTQWGDLLTAYNGTAITYDGIGNPLSDGTWTYTWQHGRRLASMTDGETTWTYTYNADGLRTKRTDGTTIYTYAYYNGLLQYMEKNGTPYYITYTPDGTPMGIVENDTPYYFVTNLQGDVVGIVTYTGVKVVSYTYDAWGKVLSVTGSRASTIGQNNPIRYRGYVYDSETGLYYLQSRYYNPQIGRFLNADGFIITSNDINEANAFIYAGNNPVMYSDPTGHIKEWEQFGFRYSGSACDFKRLEQGLPPLEYENWLKKGGTKQVNHVIRSEHNTTYSLKEVTYIPADSVTDVYIKKLEAQNDFDYVDVGITLSGFYKKMPTEVENITLAYGLIKLAYAFGDWYDSQEYKAAIVEGKGMLAIRWDVSGAGVVPVKIQVYKAWESGDGELEGLLR